MSQRLFLLRDLGPVYGVHLVFHWVSVEQTGQISSLNFVVSIRDLAALYDDVWIILKSAHSGTICKPSILSKLARKVGVKVEGKCSATSKQKDQSNLTRKQDERVLVASSSIMTMANHSMSSLKGQWVMPSP